MRLSQEVLSPTPEQEKLLSKLPRAIILASHTGLEAPLANLLNEASIADCLAISVREPLRDAIRGILCKGNPGFMLETIDEKTRAALEYEIEKAIKNVYGDEGLALLAINYAQDAKDWPTAVFCEGNDTDNALIAEHFKVDGAYKVYLLTEGVSVGQMTSQHRYIRVEDGMSPNELLRRFCEAVDSK